MNNKNQKIKIIKDREANELIMVRVDKTAKEMMEEKLGSRWDPNYWHPKYESLEKELGSAFPKQVLKDFIPQGSEGLTYGAIITGEKNTHKPGGIPLIGPNEMKFTGLDLSEVERTKPGSKWDPKRSKANYGNLLLARSGVGTLGKTNLWLSNKYANVGCFVDRIRLTGISPFYVNVFMKSKYGHLQIERFTTGVAGTTNISFDQIRSLRIPVLSKNIQSHIKQEYLKMSKFHDKAMKAKKKGDEKGYKENLETAEKMLKDLISKTEAVIESDRKDVI